jgi:hypothetical protein
MVLFVVVAGTLILRLSFSVAMVVTKTGNSVEISTPGGRIALHAGNPEDLGLPVYPGAKVSENATGGSVEFVGTDNQRSGVSGATYSTTDPIEKVDDRYRHRLGTEFGRNGPGPMHVDVRGINVEIDSGDIAYISDSVGIAVVGLKPRAGHVEISLARLGKQGQAQ